MRFTRSSTYLFLLLSLALSFSFAEKTQAASMTFTPSSTSFPQGCSAKIDLVVDTQGVSTNAVDAVILFNPSEVLIEDQNASAPGSQIKPGSIYEIYAGNLVNESQGKILLTAFSVIGDFNGSGLLGSVYFQSKPGVTSTTFQFEFSPGQSTDSNVADTSGNDVLSSVNSGSYTFQTSPCVPDTQAPSVSQLTPANGATNVDLNTDISLHLSDNQSGVDVSSVEIQVHNVIYSSSDPEVTLTGLPLDYTFTIDPVADFPDDTEIVIVVQATDIDGNVMSPKVYSFNKPPTASVPSTPSAPVCGNGVVETGENCEPADTLVCDSNCQAVISACLPGSADTAFVGELASSGFVQGVSNALFGVDEIAGVNVENLQVGSFVCNDTRIDNLEVSRTETPYTPPDGYEIIRDPFQLQCSGAYETTLNIPEEYIDVKAVKCLDGACSDVQVSSVQSIQCGGEVVVEKENVASKTAELEITRLERVFESSRYSVSALESDGREYTLARFDQAYQSSFHSSLKLLSSAVEVKRRGNVPQGKELVRLSFPFVSDPLVEKRTIQIYSYDSANKRWNVVREAQAIEDLSIVSEVDYSKYAGADGVAEFAVMGAVCEDCEQTRFELVYEPIQQSKAAVILVHGMTGSAQDWSAIVDDIRRTEQPWQVWVYDYRADKSLEETAKDLARSIQIHADEFEVAYVIGHGTGGVVTQETLAYSQRENFINAKAFTFIKKIKKAILIGTPNDPFESENLIFTFYDYLVNSGVGNLFALRNGEVKDLLRPRAIPQVQGIEYFVIAGNKGLDESLSMSQFGTAALFEGNVANDGFVPVTSAQHVGGEYLQTQCENYWEIGANHLELLQHPSSRKVIGKLISQDISKALKEVPLYGHQKYFLLADASCSSDDKYLLIGKKVRREKAPDDLMCSCGNGYCGVDEDAVSCPSDCANVFRKENYPYFYAGLGVLAVVLLSLGLSTVWRRMRSPQKGKGRK